MAAASSAEADTDNEASAINWSRISAYLSQVATDSAFDLPPLTRDLGFVRCCHVLAALCQAAYHVQADQVGRATAVELPLAGPLHAAASVSATLHHFRPAALGQDLGSPQQYGIWEVAGLGIVVAFRGTASSEDVLIDINIAPVPLTPQRPGHGDLRVHRGFYDGTRQHVDAIVSVVTALQVQRPRKMPVWITGHSLGGGYANALLLHMLHLRSTAQLFGAGGGSLTFGAPMVVYGDDPASLYTELATLESYAEGAAPEHPRLAFHNVVNNADVVPRLLGESLDPVHGAMEAYIPAMQGVGQAARRYRPFGAYHIIMGSQMRSLRLPAAGGPGGRYASMGDAAYAQEVTKQLDVSRIWKAVYATSGRGGGTTHHSIAMYRGRIEAYLKSLALDLAGQSLAPAAPEAVSLNQTSLFAPPAGARGADGSLQGLLDELGATLGAAGRVAAADLGATAYQTVSGYFVKRDGGGDATTGAPAAAQTWREWMHSWIPYSQSGQPSEVIVVEEAPAMTRRVTRSQTRRQEELRR